MKNYQQHQSDFICSKCKKENPVGQGIYRKRLRERFHVKDIYCIHCQIVTKNLEVRRTIDVDEDAIKKKINELHSRFYEEVSL